MLSHFPERRNPMSRCTGVLVGAVAVAFGLPVVVMLALLSMVPPFVPASQVTVRLTVAPQSSHLPSPFASTWSAYSVVLSPQAEQDFVRLCWVSSAFDHEPYE